MSIFGGHPYSSCITVETNLIVRIYLFTAIRELYDYFPHLNEVVSRKRISDIQK